MRCKNIFSKPICVSKRYQEFSRPIYVSLVTKAQEKENENVRNEVSNHELGQEKGKGKEELGQEMEFL